MSHRFRARFLVAAILVASAAAQTTLLSAQTDIEVAITSPEFGQPVFGPTRIAAEVYPPSAVLSQVDFYLDGFLVATDREAPYEVEIDAGQDNREHRIEVVAVGADGTSASASIATAKIETDLEVEVELRQIFVTVSNENGRITGLPQSVFALFDDGNPQSLVTFAGGEVPFSATLLVDASRSMAGGKLETAVQGAKTFIDGLRPLDEAKLILFSDRVLRETPFSSFSRLMVLGLQGTVAEGGSAVHDAVYLGIKRLTPRLSRKVLILLSDGRDVESVLPMEQVLTVLRREQAVLYWIRLTQGSAELTQAGRKNSWRGLEQNQQQLEILHQAIQESGGRIITVSGVEEAGRGFGEILEELRDQYVLGYYPSSQRGPGSWHDVEVRVGANARVRARSGYLER